MMFCRQTSIWLTSTACRPDSVRLVQEKRLFPTGNSSLRPWRVLFQGIVRCCLNRSLPPRFALILIRFFHLSYSIIKSTYNYTTSRPILPDWGSRFFPPSIILSSLSLINLIPLFDSVVFLDRNCSRFRIINLPCRELKRVDDRSYKIRNKDQAADDCEYTRETSYKKDYIENAKYTHCAVRYNIEQLFSTDLFFRLILTDQSSCIVDQRFRCRVK